MKHQDYTVGWICALPIEMAAAVSMLDNRHDPLPQPHHDHYVYTLGRIGEHNVAIACLPAGVIGVTSTARVMIQMCSTFRSIRFGLMVGIGGGGPSVEHDIRLGDVVVGIPSDISGGVIQYDFGKTLQEGRSMWTSSLNRPPTVLLSAVSALRSRHMMEEPALSKYLSEMMIRNSRLGATFTDPGKENDRLFSAEYDHQGDHPTCLYCDKGRLIERPARPQDGPVIHYGVIASADQVMKHGATRDRMQRELGVLCFEMEAAGLLDNFPCLVIRGICDYADSHKNKRWQPYAAATGAAYAKELLCIIPRDKVIGTRVAEGMTSEALSPPPEPVFLIPFERDHQFVGRKDIISQIDNSLRNKHQVSLCGLGGVGKSQIAVEYAYKFRENHPHSHVFWVCAATVTRFDQGFQGIARKLGLPGWNDRDVDSCELVSEWLNDENKSWLLILDNADDRGMFFPSTHTESSLTQSMIMKKLLIDYLPKRLDSKRSLMVTTRGKDIGEDFACGDSGIEVSPLPLDEAMDLLFLKTRNMQVRADIPDSDPAALLSVLAYMPLAIIQAAAFMSWKQISPWKYLAALHQDASNLTGHLSAELQDHQREHEYPSSIFRTWKLSFDQIQEQRSQAAELLSLMAMLETQHIPESILKRPNESSDALSSALDTLSGLSLITPLITRGAFAMHRLVQLSVHNWLEQVNLKEYEAEQALQLLAERFPKGDFENLEICESFLPHAQIVLQYDVRSKAALIHRASLLYKVGLFEWRQGKFNLAHKRIFDAYTTNQEELGDEDTRTLESLALLALILQSQEKCKEAEEIYRRVIRSEEKVFGGEHPETLRSMSNLALVLDQQGKCEEAEEIHRRVIRSEEKVFGGEHPETLRSISNLALVQGQQGKYEEAEEMHRQALELNEKVLGWEHPAILRSLTNLALVLERQARYGDAEIMHRKALELSWMVLGKEHPHALTNMSNLALVLDQQGKYKEAEEMHREVLRLKEIVLGVEHPETLTSMSNLALVLRHQGKYEEAEEIHRKVLELSEEVLGKGYPDMLKIISNLASVLDREDKYDEAEEMPRRALKLYEQVLGKEHPETLRSMSKLASILEHQGKHEEAEEMYREVLRLEEKVLGGEHPETLRSISNLALVLGQQGKYEEAERIHRQALELNKKVLGWEHRDTLSSMANLASAYRNQGRRKDTEELLMQVTETFKRVLGEEHPDTLSSMANLASTYRNQGRWKDAEELLVQVTETFKRVLGEEHPDTLTNMANLASIYRNEGRWKEAEELLIRVTETFKRVLGEEHPDTLSSMANLASTYQIQGRWKEAEELLIQVTETFKRVLGDEHLDTLTSIANLASIYRNVGRWKEAEELFMQVMETFKRVLGEEHPDTLSSMANLASTYQTQGRWKEAEELLIQVTETFKRVLGDEHPDTLTSMANLASIYGNEGRWKEAEELFMQVTETFKRVLGKEHPDTLSSMANLASTMWNQGQLEKAEELEVQVMETYSRVLGQEHPNTLTSTNNLALTYQSQGRWKEAEGLQLQVLETYRMVLGPDHPDTLTSMANLAYTWKSQGQEEEAIELLKRVEGLLKKDTRL